MKATPEDRRIENIQKRRAIQNLERANRALAERHAILAELRALPIKKLRAITKAARTAFA